MQQKTNLKIQPITKRGERALDIVYEEENKLAWYKMNAHPRPCFTAELIHNIYESFCDIKDGVFESVDYVVMASSVPKVFSLGGDLDLFKQLIKTQDKDALEKYAYASIKPLYMLHTGLSSNVTTISLVQGDALGAGFETALSTDVLIAERNSKMGFPEVLFNMFPGMGAYSFISRKVSASLAKKMILEGKLYSACELYDMGIVDILVGEGEGEQAVYDYIKRENRSKNTYESLKKVKKVCSTVTFEEIKEVTSIWIDANMHLSDKNLRMMERLVQRQSAKVN